MKLLLRFVGKGVSPKGISRTLGGDPHDSCLWGDTLSVLEADGSVRTQRALTGFWKREVDVNEVGGVSAAVGMLFVGLTTDRLKWIGLSTVHRAGIAVTEAPPGTTAGGLFTRQELEVFERYGLAVNIYPNETDE